ncbi:MAG TPA: NmrA family NAD(P)-binding protein, partial [Polyangiaceae bacterium]
VITGASGHTGSVAAKTLLAAGKKVRAVVRNANKGKELAALGAEVFVADMTDQAALAKAFAGAEAVYLLSPPDMGAKDFVAERKALTEKQVNTVKNAKVPHVVLLSSVGAHQSEGTGPILTTHNFEQQLRASGVPSTFVRAAYFVENWAAVLHPLKQDGVLPTFIPADKTIPMVATADIGTQIAQALLDGPRDVRVIELAGPVDASPKDVAGLFAKILGKPVNLAEAPVSAVVPTFTSFGISQNIAELFQQMYEGVISGRVTFSGAELVRGKTPLETTLRGLLG